MKLHLIDGNSYAYRAFYGLPRLTNSKGQATQAVYGVAIFLLKLLKDKSVTDVVVAFDPPGPTFRHKEFVHYKAQRKPTPDELISQFPLIHELVRALGIACVQRDGYEADDVIATFARHAWERGGEVVIYSGDKDILQLVRDRVKVKVPRREDEEVDAAAVRKRWGVPPERMVDLLGLMGDSSDNLPGVPGVGEKTAGALLAQFGSIDAVFERLAEVKSPRLREKLAAAREEAMRTRDLAELKDRLPLSPGEERTSLTPPDVSRLKSMFTELEFASLLASLPVSGQIKTERTAGPIPQALKRPGRELKADLKGPQDVLCLPLGGDLALETAGGRWLIPASPENLRDLASFWKDERPRKVTFGLKDLARLACTEGIRMSGVRVDVQLAAYLAGGRSSGLMELARAQLGPGDPPEGTEEGAGWALDSLKGLAPLLEKSARSEGVEKLLREVEMPLAPILAEMESRGIALDAKKLAKVTERIRGRLTDLEHEIMKDVGSEFNLLSPRQVGEILFKKLNLPAKRKTKTGYSTNESVLEELAPLHPAPGKILEYRKLAKLLSTYLEPLPGFCGPDGLLHTRFNQMGAATGRLSSSDPNLQNIPIRGEIGQQIRAAFVPRSRDLALLSADYSQVELRILAHMSGDEAFLESFARQEDIHSSTAAEMFGKAVKDVKQDERRAAKAVNFGIIYGMTAFGLARELKCPPKLAAEYLERYFSLHPAVRSYWEKTLKQAREEGCVTTLMGRRRRLPEISSSVKARREESEREALNHPIQGTAADIMKVAIIRCARAVPEAGLLLSIHDELLFEVPRERESALAAKVRREMECAMELAVPLVVETAWGSSWAECHP